MAIEKSKKSRKLNVVDTKIAAANDVQPVLANIPARLTAEQIVELGEKAEKATKPATAVSIGANLAIMAGRPPKQAVISVFTKSGYALSWVARAAQLVRRSRICNSQLWSFVLTRAKTGEKYKRRSNGRV